MAHPAAEPSGKMQNRHTRAGPWGLGEEGDANKKANQGISAQKRSPSGMKLISDDQSLKVKHLKTSQKIFPDLPR